MKMLGLLIWLVAGAVQAAQTDETFLVTGTVIENPFGDPGLGTPGQSLQFQYTFNPLADSQDNPITAISYSLNGGAFQSDWGWGGGDANNFTLYPGNGAEISLNMSQGTMLVYGNDGSGAYARVNNMQQMGVQSLTAQAPEIDPNGWVSGLTLLIGGLFVLRGRLLRHDLVDRGGLRC